MQVFVHDDVHHAQGQGGVGARQRAQVPIGLRRGPRFERIDHYHCCAGGPGLADKWPQMKIGYHRVGAPQDDDAAVCDVLGQHAGGGAEGGHDAAPGGAGADVPLQASGAEACEEAPVQRAGLHDALRAHVAVRQDGGGAVPVDEAAQAGGNVGDGLVPADALKLAVALGTNALQGMEHAVWAVHAVQVVIDLGAQDAAREGLQLVADQLDGRAVFNLDLPTAAVGAVVRTGAGYPGWRGV